MRRPQTRWTILRVKSVRCVVLVSDKVAWRAKDARQVYTLQFCWLLLLLPEAPNNDDDVQMNLKLPEQNLRE